MCTTLNSNIKYYIDTTNINTNISAEKECDLPLKQSIIELLPHVSTT